MDFTTQNTLPCCTRQDLIKDSENLSAAIRMPEDPLGGPEGR